MARPAMAPSGPDPALPSTRKYRRCYHPTNDKSDLSSQPAAEGKSLKRHGHLPDFRMIRLGLALFLTCIAPALGAASVANKPPDIYEGWLRMYDLKFDEAHRVFASWSEAHPEDPLAPASDAAAYLFSELARLGALESELFVDDLRFINRKKLSPDESVREKFTQSLSRADELADALLKGSADDPNALFVKSLVCGLRADYATLIEKENMAALAYTKQGRPFADKLLSIKPDAYDAYLGLGVENYIRESQVGPDSYFPAYDGIPH